MSILKDELIRNCTNDIGNVFSLSTTLWEKQTKGDVSADLEYVTYSIP